MKYLLLNPRHPETILCMLSLGFIYICESSLQRQKREQTKYGIAMGAILWSSTVRGKHYLT